MVCIAHPVRFEWLIAAAICAQSLRWQCIRLLLGLLQPERLRNSRKKRRCESEAKVCFNLHHTVQLNQQLVMLQLYSRCIGIDLC
jgi:hypothetical protein